MPTVMTHAVVGLGLGKVFTARKLPWPFWILTAVLPMVPDLDVLAFGVGIPYQSPFGHRGFTHSLCFALVLSLTAAVLFSRRCRMPWTALAGFFFLITAAHGILDALTDGGRGVALFWPFDSTRYFFPWRPIKVSPIGLKFFREAGWKTLASEFLWVWLPTGVLVGAVLLVRRVGVPLALCTGQAGRLPYGDQGMPPGTNQSSQGG
ncbi:MAG: metal-dependent hydrolase [Planctomycetes bacterium]|nr:metal-dependent hydrolase [Planctomycetota bacterium]